MPDTIRVLHIIAAPMTGVKIVYPIARRQLEMGYQVEFASGPGEFLDQLRELGFPLNVVPLNRKLFSFSHFPAVVRLWHLIRTRRYHVVHTHTPIASFLGRIAAALSGTPIIIYHMRTSWWESNHALIRKTFTLLEKISGLWTTHIFTINCTDASDLLEHGIKPSKSVTCLHCGGGGVDTRRFSPARALDCQTDNSKREFGLRAGDHVIGYIGRVVREKGVLELFLAFRDIARTNPDVSLLIVGGVLSSERDRSTLPKLREMIAENHLEKRVIFTGFRDDIASLIALMDVLVLPSYREGFGMVLAEASAMGKPVIASDNRGGFEAVTHAKNGMIVPRKDPDALRDAILTLLSDPELRQQMGAEGRRLALERFDEEVVFDKIQTAYARFLQEKNLPVPGQPGE